MTKHKTLRLGAVLALGLGLAGCAGMSDTQRATATGAGIGALGGAALGSLSGNAGWGALIGAGVGGASGYAIGRSNQSR
ncbi:YMGG-like glycine zipper-containing protein [Neoroseomonas rubea]|uniref:YMGG-like glycine zipper-containing protein n=1 Tax=Neoroseomonas rubea TaxID=2748666 RepID=UPI0018DF5360|nr:glycine zipper domain-containing protein [Roseomonas rubea]